VAVSLPAEASVVGSANRPERPRPPKNRTTNCQDVRPPQARILPYVPPFIRHAPPRGRIQHPDRSGTARAQGREDHDDLHTGPQLWAVGGSGPDRPLQSVTGYRGPVRPLRGDGRKWRFAQRRHLKRPRTADPWTIHERGCSRASWADPYTHS